MTDLKLYGELLTANRAEMKRRFRLLPFGEPGRTNKGVVTVAPGVLPIPSGQLPVNDDHAAATSVGYMTASETPEGLEAEVQYYPTPSGEQAYDAAETGERKGLSVEVMNPIIRGGKLIAGRLVGAGVVKVPAFPSALLLASDFGDLDNDEDEDDTEAGSETETGKTPEDTTNSGPAGGEPKPEGDAVGKTPVPAAASPEALLASLTTFFANGGNKPEEKQQEPAGVSVDTLTASLFGLETHTDPVLKAAALDVVTQSDIYDPTTVPQYVGELWNGRHRPQIYVPLFTEQALTALMVEGWRIVKKPTFDDWDPAWTGAAPNEAMSDIHSNEVSFERTSSKAKRVARGSRFDRAVAIDFPNPQAMAVFLREEVQALSDLMDQKAKAFFLSNTVKKEATGSDATDAWSKLVYGIAHVLEYSTPTHAVVGNDIWREMQVTSEMDRAAWLEAQLGLEDGTLKGFKLQPARIREADMNGRIIVSAKPSLTFRTPPGAPFRVDAQELQKGAVDKAVFSYWHADVDPDAVDALADDGATVIPTATPGIVEVTDSVVG